MVTATASRIPSAAIRAVRPPPARPRGTSRLPDAATSVATLSGVHFSSTSSAMSPGPRQNRSAIPSESAGSSVSWAMSARSISRARRSSVVTVASKPWAWWNAWLDS